MKHNVVAPSVGESITEVSILKWHKQSGQAVKTGELLLEIESDKATVEVVAPQSGVLQVVKQAGDRIPIGEVIGFVDDAGKATVAASAPTAAAPTKAATPPPAPVAAANVGGAGYGNQQQQDLDHLSPAVRRAVMEQQLNASNIQGTGRGGRITKGDVINHNPQSFSASTPAAAKPAAPQYVDKPGDRRVPMTNLRKRIAERLVQSQHTAAILTTFNEVDMTAINTLRNKHKDAFKTKHGVPLSYMSFFTYASIAALKAIPEVNAAIDGNDIIYHDYYDIGIAVGTERGLVVPVVRDAHKLSVVDFEKKVAELAVKARDGKLGIADMTGGTFTISNGGTYGSLLSTPIINPPQAGILGMHKIMDRPMVVNGKIEGRPMMYVALSYDHRLIDGKGAVTWLVTLKDFLENPEKLKLQLT